MNESTECNISFPNYFFFQSFLSLFYTPARWYSSAVQIMYIKYDVTTQPQKPTKSFLLSAVTRSDSLQQIVLVASTILQFVVLKTIEEETAHCKAILVTLSFH